MFNPDQEEEAAFGDLYMRMREKHKKQQFKIEWFDRGREPQNPSNPAYPHGEDIDRVNHSEPFCKVELPYPAKRCGYYFVRCEICGYTIVITTAGRPDDPRSVLLPCVLETRLH